MNAVPASRHTAAAALLTPTKRSNYGAVAADHVPQVPDVEGMGQGLGLGRSIAGGTEAVSPPYYEDEDGGDSSCVSITGSTVMSRRDKTNANRNDISNHSLISQGTNSSHSYLSADDTSGSGGSSGSTDSSQQNYPPSSPSGYEAVGDSVLQGVYAATLGMALPFTSAFAGSPNHHRLEREGGTAEGSESGDEESGRDASSATTRTDSEAFLDG